MKKVILILFAIFTAAIATQAQVKSCNDGDASVFYLSVFPICDRTVPDANNIGTITIPYVGLDIGWSGYHAPLTRVQVFNTSKAIVIDTLITYADAQKDVHQGLNWGVRLLVPNGTYTVKVSCTCDGLAASATSNPITIGCGSSSGSTTTGTRAKGKK